MGGGFMLVERTDLRIAVKEAIFEMSEADGFLVVIIMGTMVICHIQSQLKWLLGIEFLRRGCIK